MIMSSTKYHAGKLRTLKHIPDDLTDLQNVVKTNLESHNKGCLVLSSTGQLVILAWIRKKLFHKTIADVSDALWQHGEESELVAACHSGAFLRYSLQHDTGLTCSLQLSAPTFLSLLKERDATIQTVKSARIWGHTEEYILIQPQPDRLVVLSTNTGDRPSVIEVIRTLPLRSAHILASQILVQPIIGSDLYIYDARNGKTTELITLSILRVSSSYIEWGCLSCSSISSKIALTDSERRLYLSDLSQKINKGKKGGIMRSVVTPQQIVWPVCIRPLGLYDITISLSKDSLSVFCSETNEDKTFSYYLTCDFEEKRSLLLVHKFEKPVCLIPGLMYQLPDLFLSKTGISMLVKQDSSKSLHLESDFQKARSSLKAAMVAHDMLKMSQIKSAIEQDLCIFLSSCNHKDDWLDSAECRSMQHADLADAILSHLTKLSTQSDDRSGAMSLKAMAKHHFQTMKEEMHNVLKYVDEEAVSQMLLKMTEQMQFYLLSIDAIRFPEGQQHKDQGITEKFELWGDKSWREVIQNALEEGCVNVAESYLKLKPWLYGTIDPEAIITTCIEIARENQGKKLLMNLEKSYADILKKKLCFSKELHEIQLLEDILLEWDYLTAKETLSLHLLKNIYMTCPYLIARPMRCWQTLISIGNNEQNIALTEELNVAVVSKWTDLSLMLVHVDLFARTGDFDILSCVTADAVWLYLILHGNESVLSKWTFAYLKVKSDDDIISSTYKSENILPCEGATADVSSSLAELGKCTFQNVKSRTVSNSSKSPDDYTERDIFSLDQTFRKPLKHNESLLGFPIYASDTDSLCSIDSSVAIQPTNSPFYDTTLPYIVPKWPEHYFSSLTQPMVDNIEMASKPISEKLLSVLSQFGIFTSKEKQDLQKIFKRWISIPNFDMKIRETCFEGRISQYDLDSMILNLFGALNLHSPFYEYTHRRKLNLGEFPLEERSNQAWVQLIQHFDEQQFEQNFFQLSIDNLKYLISIGETDKTLQFATFLTMIAASNTSLQDFLMPVPSGISTQPSDGSVSSEVETLCSLLSQINQSPFSVVKTLASKLFPFLEPLVNDDMYPHEIDVSMYDLLNGNVPFDVSTLFPWQKTNNFGYLEGSSFPSFVEDSLSVSDVLKYPIDFTYFLKLGRPTFSLVSILEEKPDEGQKRMEHLEGIVYGIALSSWPDRSVFSSCVALLYMADLNYEVLRMTFQTCEVILRACDEEANRSLQRDLCQTESNLFRQELSCLLLKMCSLETRDDAIQSLLHYLERATISTVTGVILLKSNCSSSRVHNGKLIPTERNIFLILQGLVLGNCISSHFELKRPTGLLDFLSAENHWMLFLAAAEIFKYPIETVICSSQKFESVALREHMFFALYNPHLYKHSRDKEIITEASSNEGRSLRAKTIIDGYDSEKEGEYCNVDAEVSSEFSQSSQASLPGVINDHMDIMSLYLECHKKANPTRRLIKASISLHVPVFAVMAGCYSGCDKNACFLAWLISIAADHRKLIKCDLISSEMTINEPLTCDDLFMAEKQSELMRAVILSFVHFGFLDILLDGFKIFFENNYLISLLEALQLTKEEASIESITKKLTSGIFPLYRDSLFSMRNPWMEKVYLDIFCFGCDKYLRNHWQKRRLLGIVLAIKEKYPFNIYDLPWESICTISDYMANFSGSFGMKHIVQHYQDDKAADLGCELVHFLIERQCYDTALVVAKYFTLSEDDILCAQFHHQFLLDKDDMMNSFIGMNAFLHKIHEKAVAEEIPPLKVSKVFELFAEKAQSPVSTFFSYAYAVMCSQSQEASSEFLELKMWTAFINSKLQTDPWQKDLDLKPPKSFENWPWERKAIDKCFNLRDINRNAALESTIEDFTDCERDEAFERGISDLIGLCLGEGLLVTSKRICNLFLVDNKDVKCLSSILEAVNNNEATSDTSTDELNLHNLSADLCNGGKVMARRILQLKDAAEAISLSFSNLVSCLDSLKLLKNILSLKRSDRLLLARGLIDAYPISCNEVRRLLIEEAVATITAGPSNSGTEFDGGSFLSWNELEDQWRDLLTLTDSPSLIGHQLLDIGLDFGSTHPDQVLTVHRISVELVIRAHDCFSQAANMEGITIVLQKCRTLINSLVSHRLWQLMVRLLVGIRRYYEMFYIIDILRERDQFEHLLGRVSDNKWRRCGLDRALLHYLRTKHPQDKDTLKLVALHFLLYSEVAKMYEAEGKAALERILEESLFKKPRPEVNSRSGGVFQLFKRSSDSPEVSPQSPGSSRALDYLKDADVALFTVALEAYTHAAQYYLQEYQTVKAVRLSRLAQLVALQMSFVKKADPNGLALRIIHLPVSHVSAILTQHLSVAEALIMGRSYDVSIDWAAAIFHHFIIGDDCAFLEDFLRISFLSSDIVIDITKKVENRANTPGTRRRMSKLLKYVSDDTPLMYQVASRLSLRDIIDQCLKSSAVSYLKDTVFSQGYSN